MSIEIKDRVGELIDKNMVDNVNHPKHYGRAGAMECIEEMLLVFGVDSVKEFCLLNAWKYRYRAADKNGTEDIKKSDWYMNKYKELSSINKYLDCDDIPAWE